MTEGSAQTGADRAALILARQNRIDVWALPWHYLAIIGTGYFFTFYDIADIGFALPQIQSQFGLTGNESTFLALAIGLIGYAVGSVLIGSLADRVGRFRMLIVTITLTAIGSFGDAAAQSLVMLIVFRFITGWASAPTSTSSPPTSASWRRPGCAGGSRCSRSWSGSSARRSRR